MSGVIIILVAVALGFFLKNVKTGLLIGLGLGLLMSGLLSRNK